MTDAATKEGRIAQVRKAVFGDGHPPTKRTSYAAPLIEWSEQAVWDTWARPALSIKLRSLITIAALGAMVRPEQLEIHLRAALRNGWTADELGEVAAHLAIYAGAPAAATMIGVLTRVVETGGAEGGHRS